MNKLSIPDANILRALGNLVEFDECFVNEHKEDLKHLAFVLQSKFQDNDEGKDHDQTV